jgi:hypothetical protein
MRCGAGVVLAFVVAAGLAATAAARTPMTITLSSSPGELVRQAHAPAGDLGDVLSSSLVLAATNGAHTKMGAMTYSFTMLGRATARVETTTTLRDGTIRATAMKLAIDEPTLTVTITGGTGRYAGARGTLTFGPMTTQRNVYRLTLP